MRAKWLIVILLIMVVIAVLAVFLLLRREKPDTISKPMPETATWYEVYFSQVYEGDPTTAKANPNSIDRKLVQKLSTAKKRGFFKTARFGVEDTLTLFSRQTPPIGGKSAEKSCDSVAFATADTCGLNPPSRWFPSQSPTAQRGSDPGVCHGQRVRYCVLSPTTTGIPDSLVF